ncbi:hypothetical protein ACFW0H_26415 [Pseudomonas sp. CR3202]|uniref:hypothetical protein n=1 Tax=Pseudomonas sp. CR3202 TaxID=3351532 RepID=UPI003BF23417
MGIQDFLRGVDVWYLYVLIVFAFVFSWVVRRKIDFAAFVLVLNFPLSACCYFYFSFGVGPKEIGLVTVLMNLFAFAQIGWGGALVFLIGCFFKSNICFSLGVVLSVVSVGGHALFVLLLLLFGAGS